MITVWKNGGEIVNRIYIPKYYDPTIRLDLAALERTHFLATLGESIEQGHLSVSTGDEIGKMVYGTGDIPFLRTSDISNWEIKSTPKQGVSEEVYRKYASKQDVRTDDILLVRDGTYLIGTNCLVSSLDNKFVYQSHILKIRVEACSPIPPQLLFLALNSGIVQRQIRNKQFTADTIDTIGDRYKEVVIAIPRSRERQTLLAEETQQALSTRELGKAFVRQAAFLIEEALRSGDGRALDAFLSLGPWQTAGGLVQDTITSEFGGFGTFWIKNHLVRERILIPRYYNPEIAKELDDLTLECDCVPVSKLVDRGCLEISTGDEIGKMAYGTGDIPFLRTADFSNWEIKHDPKQAVSEDIYEAYASNQDLRINDILLVRDGTYLVGSSCIVTELDEKALFCGGLYKIRATGRDGLTPFLLLGLLNSYIVKRQIRTKQFTRDVIDTLGRRLMEIVIPIPRSRSLRESISGAVEGVVRSRVEARRQISQLSESIAS